MDEMKLESKLVRGIVAKVIKKVLKKKLGYDIEFQINEANATLNDERLYVHLSVDAEMDKEDLKKLLSGIDKD